MIESREKLLHELKHMAGVINDYDDLLNVDCESWVILDALELLKEQEPVKPIRMHHSEHKQTDNYRCEKCGDDIYFEQRFCEYCGRPVKWE